jgi:hypothetical protein
MACGLTLVGNQSGGSGNPAVLVYPGVYPGSHISLILIGKINVAETNKENFHSGTWLITAAEIVRYAAEPQPLLEATVRSRRRRGL